MRSDLKKDLLINYNFMGTVQKNSRRLPDLFTPEIINLDYNDNYKSKIFENDVFIFNMKDANFNDIDYIIKGLKALKYEKEKILVIVTSIMTWARTQPKYKKEEGAEEEKEEGDEGEGEGEEKKEEEKKEEDEENKEQESEEEEYAPPEEEEVPDEEKKEEEKKEEEEEGKEQESEEEEYVPPEEEEGEGGEEKKEEEEEKKEGEGEEGGEQKEPKKILYFKEKDFIKRIPSPKFYHDKMVETLALSNTNPKLKTYIICPGFIYGCGEDLFYDYFKMSWLEIPGKLPIIGKGKNTIPTIHIKDLVSLIRRVIETKPKNKYIFAVDHTKNRQLSNIIKKISKGVGNGLVENLEPDKKDKIPHFAELSIDIKVKPSKIFNDERRDDEEDEAFEKRKFQWHCEFGIPENIEKLRQEFNEYRGMHNLKVLITGPPGSGKTYLSEKLSKFFNIPHFKIKDIIDWGKTFTDELGEEIKAKIEEITNSVKEAEENYAKRPNKKKTDLPLDTSQMSKLPDEIVVKILRKKLAQNICRNRGYILDGYPRGYKNAFNLFNEDTDEAKTPDDPTKYKVLEEILPNIVIRIDNCDDKFIKERMKKLEDINNDPNVIQRRLDRRLKAYKELNESKKGEPSITNFFKENKVDILGIDGKAKEGEIIEACKTFLEKNGKIINYQIFDNEFEVVEKENVNKKVDSHKIVREKEQIENEYYDIEKSNVKKQYNEGKSSELEKQEKDLLEKKSEVLRRYLAENVIPVLSKGILHVCKTLPEDPVDELAYYLFDNAFNAKFPPHKYKDQK
jgi:adenylate kinase